MPILVEFYRQYISLRMPVNVDKKIPNKHMSINVDIGDNVDNLHNSAPLLFSIR